MLCFFRAEGRTLEVGSSRLTRNDLNLVTVVRVPGVVGVEGWRLRSDDDGF